MTLLSLCMWPLTRYRWGGTC